MISVTVVSDTKSQTVHAPLPKTNHTTYRISAQNDGNPNSASRSVDIGDQNTFYDALPHVNFSTHSPILLVAYVKM